MFKKILPVIFYSFFLVVAGDNAGAEFFVDMVPSSGSVEDSYYDTETGQQFQVAVFVTGVSDLNAFSVRLKIVSGDYSADGADKDITGRTNILELGGATGLFFDNIETDKIEFVGSIGSSTASPSDTGLLGVFTLTSELDYNESVAIEIYDAVLTSTGGDVDEFTEADVVFTSGS